MKELSDIDKVVICAQCDVTAIREYQLYYNELSEQQRQIVAEKVCKKWNENG
jgi:hypothetical protein